MVLAYFSVLECGADLLPASNSQTEYLTFPLELAVLT